MREIKFRAWDPNNSTMHSGIEIKDLHLYHFDGNKITEEEALELMQYTGLKDKNGKEIYEGDICSTDLSRPYLIVVFRNGAFIYQCHDDGKDYFDIMLPTEVESDVDKYTEVIGNIYENPEFLEIEG